MLSLNLCCGANKFKDCDNVDLNSEFNPELNFNICDKFPIEDNKYDKVYLFHAIEHQVGKLHRNIFREIHRVLKENGELFLSYPEFKVVAQNWIDNKWGRREFWGWTIFGRQETPLDFHVYPMDSEEVKEQLKEVGFKDIVQSCEPKETYNTLIKCIKSVPMKIYEEVLQEDIDKIYVNAS